MTLILSAVFYSTQSLSGNTKINLNDNPMGGAMGGAIVGDSMMMMPKISVADALIDAFKCDTGSKKTNNMLQGLSTALAAVKSENCEQVRQSLNNIPHIQRITQAIQDNEVVREIKKQESIIKTFMTAMSSTEDPDRKKDLQNTVERAQTRLLELQAELAVTKSELAGQNLADSISELNTFADQMIDTINNNRECFEDNQELAQHAMASVTGIAGLVFSASPIGIGLMAASKLAQKMFAVKRPEGEKSATESVKLGIGLRCALQNINSIHCENARNATLLDKLTEAEFACETCAEKNPVPDIKDIKEGISSITALSEQAANNKQSRVIRSFRKGSPAPADRLKNISNFLQNIDEDFFSAASMDFDEDEIKNYIDKVTSVNQAYQNIEEHSTSGNKEKLSKAKDEFYTNFIQLKESDLFDPHELTDFVLEYSRFQQDSLSDTASGQATNTDALFYANLDIVHDVLALSGTPKEQQDQRGIIRESRNISAAALKDFSNSFGRHINQTLSSDQITSRSKSELCIRLLGLPNIKDIKEECKGAAIFDAGKVICFDNYAKKSHTTRACVYENFLKSMDSSHPYKNRFASNKNCKKPNTTSTAQSRTPSATPENQNEECPTCSERCKKCKYCKKKWGIEIYNMCPEEDR